MTIVNHQNLLVANADQGLAGSWRSVCVLCLAGQPQQGDSRSNSSIGGGCGSLFVVLVVAECITSKWCNG